MTEAAAAQFDYPHIIILPQDRVLRHMDGLPDMGVMGTPAKTFITADPAELIVYQPLGRSRWPELIVCDLWKLRQVRALHKPDSIILRVIDRAAKIVIAAADCHITRYCPGAENVVGRLGIVDQFDPMKLEKSVMAFYAAERDTKGKVTPEAYKAAFAALDAEDSGAQTPIFDGKRRRAILTPEA